MHQTGNAVDFGNLSTVRYSVAGLSSPVRACFGGGANPNVNTIDYVTIATTGNAQDFGDLITSQVSLAGCSNSTRGIWGGGYSPGSTNIIDFITIATTGNSTDFGDLTIIRGRLVQLHLNSWNMGWR